MATSWGQRKALGKKYSTDPALMYELERLQRQYELAPGREARGMQAAQFAQAQAQQASQFATSAELQKASQAQQASQFGQNLAFNAEQARLNRAAQEEANKQAATSGMVGTAGNLLTTAATVRAMTKAKGEPFFGKWGGESQPSSVSMTEQPMSQIKTGPGYSTNPATVDMASTATPAASGIGGTIGPQPAMTGASYQVTPATYEGMTFTGAEGAGTTGMGAGGTAAGTGGSTAGSVTSGIMSGVGKAVPYYAAAKLGGNILRNNFDDSTVAGQIGESLNRPLNVEQYWAKEIGLPEETQVVFDVLNPLAPAERWVSDQLGTVICSELYRQGEVTSRELKLAAIFRRKHVSDIAYEGYLEWATPVVRAMKRNERFNRVFKPIAKALVKQWVNIATGKKGTLFQKTVHKIGYAVSLVAYIAKRLRKSSLKTVKEF